MRITNQVLSIQLAESSKLLEVVDGEKLGGSVVRKISNELYLINLKGHELTAKMDGEVAENSRFRAMVVSSDIKSGSLELKLIRNFEEGFNKAEIKAATSLPLPQKGQLGVAENQLQTSAKTDVMAGGNTASVDLDSVSEDDAVIFRLLRGTFQAEKGEALTINIMKSMTDGSKLLEVKGYMFKAELGDTVMNSLKAVVLELDPYIELAVMKTPLENLEPLTLKSEIGKFDIAALLKGVGKFSKVNLQSLTPEDLKKAVKDSGLSFERKLLHNDNPQADEKFRAYSENDTGTKDSITRLQLANVVLGSGFMGYLKTVNDDVSDARLRYKNDGKGGAMYISLEFSKIGKTFITVRQISDAFDILVKSEEDISKELKQIDIENAFMRWQRYDAADENVFDVMKSAAEKLGGFDATV
jgi:hypothetical protein